MNHEESAGETDATDPDEIVWVDLTIELPDELGERLEKVAQEAGMSLECYCVRALFQLLQENASTEDKERLLRQLPATLRKNGCDDSVDL